jgi:hypothetical protein
MDFAVQPITVGILHAILADGGDAKNARREDVDSCVVRLLAIEEIGVNSGATRRDVVIPTVW